MPCRPCPTRRPDLRHPAARPGRGPPDGVGRWPGAGAAPVPPRARPAKECARLDARRWDVELAFKLVKRYLDLHLLWSAKPGGFLQQVWAVLTVAQIVQALRVEIAGKAGVDPFEVSLPLLVEHLPLLLADGQIPVAFVVAEGRRQLFIRPSTRTESRAPEIPPADLAPPPEGLVFVREPRYGERNCGPRAA